jgi:hypothetical protein
VTKASYGIAGTKCARTIQAAYGVAGNLHTALMDHLARMLQPPGNPERGRVGDRAVKRQLEMDIDDNWKCPLRKSFRRVQGGVRGVQLKAPATGRLFRAKVLDFTAEFDDQAVVDHPVTHLQWASLVVMED